MVGYAPVHVVSFVLDPLTCSLIKVAIHEELWKMKWFKMQKYISHMICN